MEAVKPWLQLLHTPGIGPRTYAKLLNHFDSPVAAINASTSILKELGLREQSIRHLQQNNEDLICADLEWLEGSANTIITLNDTRYPVLLREIADPPPLLFVHGDPDFLSSLQIAIVGSRNPTTGGSETARDFARHLAGASFTITSGLALGIDAASHEGALQGGGPTIAVAGTGLDRVYPARHRDLAHRIAAHGALVSEFPPGTGPQPGHFPRRNRIISGLSLGTLVIEAAQRSGSLITARLAMEQGREVFAIPGSIHNPLARGCHRLIRDGAKLVETANDVLEELGSLATAQAHATQDATTDNALESNLDPDYQRLIEAIGHDPASVDTLIERSGLTADVVSSMLLILEMRGIITALPGGSYTRTSHESHDERERP
ncbi:DNA protecting protein DprA [Solemya pervernicosa gill symbiont]|uniref:DNA protecting protein DprA n=1 Tax=Solemya pervernicosa gill symbiont TaxID=642797 RepID=A0A1T2L844_9GAMM|nr:DNA protecting protein DprA [Solemya pervernicosa gill symbiont]